MLPFLSSDDARVYGYIRVETGDEMSRRAKFVFITWIGKSLSALKKAKVSTDKAFVKQICDVSRTCHYYLSEHYIYTYTKIDQIQKLIPKVFKYHEEYSNTFVKHFTFASSDINIIHYKCSSNFLYFSARILSTAVFH